MAVHPPTSTKTPNMAAHMARRGIHHTKTTVKSMAAHASAAGHIHAAFWGSAGTNRVPMLQAQNFPAEAVESTAETGTGNRRRWSDGSSTTTIA